VRSVGLGWRSWREFHGYACGGDALAREDGTSVPRPQRRGSCGTRSVGVGGEQGVARLGWEVDAAW
jgi:hypothetical protein